MFFNELHQKSYDTNYPGHFMEYSILSKTLQCTWYIYMKFTERYIVQWKSSKREASAFCLNWAQQCGRTVKLGATVWSGCTIQWRQLHSLECDHRKQMEAKGAQMGGGGSLVNKLVQAGLCFTKVNHEILAEAGQKCYCELLKVYVRLSCRSFQNRWISLHFPMGPSFRLIHRCVSVLLVRHGKTVKCMTNWDNVLMLSRGTHSSQVVYV